MNTQTILDQMTIINLNISLWHGRKTIHKADLSALGIDAEWLSVETEAALGTKKIVSPALLKEFKSLKREALKLCEMHCISFSDYGYVVPREKGAVLCKELKQLKDTFDRAKDNLMTNFDVEVEQWITNNRPVWIPFIDAAKESKATVSGTMTFSYAVFDMQAADIPDNGLHDELPALFRELCHDVQLRCTQIHSKYLEGKEETSVKVIPLLKTMRDKLAGFLFLHPSIYNAVRDLDDNLAKLPTKGSITGIHICMLNRLVEKLSNMESLELVGNAEVCGDGELGEPEIETVPEQAGVDPISWDF